MLDGGDYLRDVDHDIGRAVLQPFGVLDDLFQIGRMMDRPLASRAQRETRADGDLFQCRIAVQAQLLRRFRVWSINEPITMPSICTGMILRAIIAASRQARPHENRFHK